MSKGQLSIALIVFFSCFVASMGWRIDARKRMKDFGELSLSANKHFFAINLFILGVWCLGLFVYFLYEYFVHNVTSPFLSGWFLLDLLFYAYLGFVAGLCLVTLWLKEIVKEPIWYIPAKKWWVKEEEVQNTEVPMFSNRNEHMLILGGTGHGKTQLLSELIVGDIGKPVSVIVFDSQGDMVDKLLKADIPNVIYIDPTDVEYPPALGLFDFDTKTGSQYEREKRTNSVIELLTFVFDSLLDTQMTSKQDVVLRYVIRLCLHVPNANIHTLRKILANEGDYGQYIDQLSDTAQSFFRSQFNTRQYNETREQILRRVYTLLEIDSLERMFSATETKLNIKDAMDEGSFILVNTAKTFLKEEGSAFLSRFIIALITQATQERKPNDLPVHLYIDEASPIIDKNITTMLETARKYNVGVHLAFQSLSQIPIEAQSSVISNTSTKCLGGVSARDARALQTDMRTDAEHILAMPRLHFLVSEKGKPAIDYTVAVGTLDKLRRRANLTQVIKDNRDRFCVEARDSTETSTVPDDDIEDFFTP